MKKIIIFILSITLLTISVNKTVLAEDSLTVKCIKKVGFIGILLCPFVAAIEGSEDCLTILNKKITDYQNSDGTFDENNFLSSCKQPLSCLGFLSALSGKNASDYAGKSAQLATDCDTAKTNCLAINGKKITDYLMSDKISTDYSKLASECKTPTPTTPATPTTPTTTNCEDSVIADFSVQPIIENGSYKLFVTLPDSVATIGANATISSPAVNMACSKFTDTTSPWTPDYSCSVSSAISAPTGAEEFDITFSYSAKGDNTDVCTATVKAVDLSRSVDSASCPSNIEADVSYTVKLDKTDASNPFYAINFTIPSGSSIDYKNISFVSDDGNVATNFTCSPKEETTDETLSATLPDYTCKSTGTFKGTEVYSMDLLYAYTEDSVSKQCHANFKAGIVLADADVVTLPETQARNTGDCTLNPSATTSSLGWLIDLLVLGSPVALIGLRRSKK